MFGAKIFKDMLITLTLCAWYIFYPTKNKQKSESRKLNLVFVRKYITLNHTHHILPKLTPLK